MGARRIAYFTAGTVGAGHLVRGVALGRALSRGDGDVAYRIFSPPSPFARVAEPWLETVSIEPSLLRSAATARDSAIARAIAAFAPDVLVVDLFWVPLVFVPLPCPAWLLLRSVPPAWLVGPVEARFDASRYQRVLAIEPAARLERFEAIDPIVVARRSDVRDRSALAALVGQDPARPLRILAQGGLPADRGPLEQAAHALDPGPWATLDLSAPDAPFPAAEWLGALQPGDRLVAAPGYNLYWEARALGFDALTTWVPMARSIDDQAARAALTTEPPRTNGADTLARMLVASE